MIVSNIKKEELKNELIDVNAYKLKVFNEKKGLLETSLKIEKNISFLPNTQLSHSEFQQIKGNADESLTNFKKKVNFLNYFSLSEDYEIKVTKGSN